MKARLLPLCLLILSAALSPAAGSKPNVICLLADDLGYGDVQCYNPERGKIPTPHIDRLAAQGMRFTDAHTSSGVCSPTRYALLTGRYHWRTRLQNGIVAYLERPLIAPDRLTIPGLLKQHGYHTGMVGKWHLGWDWNIPPEQKPLFIGKKGADAAAATDEHRAAWREYFSKPIGGGPITRGFDEYFGTDVPNWPPFCFIENDRTVGIPSEFLPASKFAKNQASQPGPALANWELEGILPAITDRACSFIERSARQPEPFFLYLPFTAPHTPIAISPEWKGRSGLNDYADFVMETDAAVGRVLDALDKSGVADKTLVFFTSDNGCAPYAGAPELEAKGHYPSGPLRGYKADAWDGGHRVPFIVRWPGVVKPDTRCDALVQQSDLINTLAETLGVTLPDNAAEDSVSLMPLLKGGTEPIREYAISHAASGLPSLRKGPWKIIFGQGGGGFGSRAPQSGGGQLYNLATDLGETKNLWAENPGMVAELTAAMEKLVSDGRSTPGVKQANDVEVKWRKFIDTATEGTPEVPPARARKKPKSAAAAQPDPKTETPAQPALAPFTPAADAAGDWAMQPDPALPNVLVIGDSISIGYTRDVRKLLAGRANVFRPMKPGGKGPDNCGDTTIGLANLDRWIAGPRWDVIHFNWGLWDLCYRDPNSKAQGGRDKVNGKISTPLPDYGRQLESLVTRLKATGAKLIWASTTQVPEGEAGRFAGDDVKYNAIAAEVMQRHGIPTDDLHALTKAFSPTLSTKPGDVHYTPEGYAKLAAQVAAKVTSALKKPTQPGKP